MSQAALQADSGTMGSRAKPSFAGEASTIANCYRVAVGAIWFLPVLTFTIPGRHSPLNILDWLVYVKLVILLAVFGCGGSVLMVACVQRSCRRTLLPLLPFGVFLAWGVTSVLWSALPVVSLGQCGGLACLLITTASVALVSSDARKVESILLHLNLSLFVFAIAILLVHAWEPNFSGLDRDILVEGADGIVHPTAAGSAASLALLLAFLSAFVMRYKWAFRWGMLFALAHAMLLYFASSRTALGMVLLTVPVIVFTRVSNPGRGLFLCGIGSLLVMLLMFDPAFESLISSRASGVQYIMRGQNTDQLLAFSGREEMWTKTWQEYEKSMLIGHGYFVTSETGRFEVWFTIDNHTAHNIYLQVLATTGAIGLGLFLLATTSLGLSFAKLTRIDLHARRVLMMLVFVGIWYAGWSMLCASFLGPVRSESVFFFTMVGIGLGQASRADRNEVVGTQDRG